MKPAKEYIKSFWGEINGGIDSSLRYISAYDIALVIKAAQLDAIEATCKRCAEKAKATIYNIPGPGTLQRASIDKQSILKVADKMKEELDET